MKPNLVKKSGLVGNKRGVDMPMPSMLTQPIKELKEIIKARVKVYKPQ
jgi:hypothetical protein